MRNSRVVRLDDSFQFYEALIDLDLSFNRIALILDKSFISQVIKQSQTELILAELAWTGLSGKTDISGQITPTHSGPQQYWDSPGGNTVRPGEPPVPQSQSQQSDQAPGQPHLPRSQYQDFRQGEDHTFIII